LEYSETLSGLSVEAFLILPVQRIPRYLLLLQDLLKFTNATHSDFNNLSNALLFIKDFAELINNSKGDADSVTRIKAIQDLILEPPPDFNLATPRRRFICEGCLQYKKQKAWLYLFSDAILFTKLERKGKRYKALITLPTASLNTDDPNVIRIISMEGTFKFSGETPKDRDHWVKLIRDTMDSARTSLLFGGDNIPAEGGNKQFLKIKDEEYAAKKRTLVDRLVASEQEYVDSIAHTSKTYLAPLRKALDSSMPYLGLSEFIDISSNFETLQSCHVTFLQSLKDRVAEWDTKPYIQDLFQQKAGFLKLYNYYVSNHHKSLFVLEQSVAKFPLFAYFLRDLEVHEKTELRVLLAEPLRRVSTYYLIMQEMLQYTKAKTEEHEQMLQVVTRLKDQTEKLNADLHEHLVGKKDKDKDKKEKDKERKLERAKSSRKFSTKS